MPTIEEEKKYLEHAESKGIFPRLLAYSKLSGPGWLQSAITLGGGSLASSLFLGVLTGYSLLWLQPFAIIFGVLMLSAISHVTLSTGQSPFVSINEEINPVLGWGWAIATVFANIVWCLPQFSLGTAAVTQNLFPSLNGSAFWKSLVCFCMLSVALLVVWAYDRGNKGVKIFDWILKIMVAVIVISFFGVVVQLSLSGELQMSQILIGFVPDFALLNEPAAVYNSYLEQTGSHKQFWESKIVGYQREVMISAAASAVGINMTFFMPFVLLRRKWGRRHRGLAKFDLWTALFIPYVLATSCVVIAAGSRFNGQPETAYLDLETKQLHKNLEKGFRALTIERAKQEFGEVQFLNFAPVQQNEMLRNLPEADKQLSAMLVRRDSFNLADSLEGLFGNKTFSHYVFGIGVLGMALSTIIILMTINGHAVSEIFGKPHKGPVFMGGALVAGLGVIGPFVWGEDSKFWLAIPTSILGFTLIPVAYLSFFLLMNNKRVLGRERPEGLARWAWNTVLSLALAIMGSAAFYVAWNKTMNGFPVGKIILVLFGILLLVGHFSLTNRKLGKKVEGLEIKIKRLSQQVLEKPKNPNP